MNVSTMRRFVLDRGVDVSGVSGTGIVAEGVQLTNKLCVVHWFGEWGTTVVHHEGIASIKHIHGHDGKTQVVWLDE
jgi:hypothetical protein